MKIHAKPSEPFTAERTVDVPIGSILLSRVCVKSRQNGVLDHWTFDGILRKTFDSSRDTNRGWKIHDEEEITATAIHKDFEPAIQTVRFIHKDAYSMQFS